MCAVSRAYSRERASDVVPPFWRRRARCGGCGRGRYETPRSQSRTAEGDHPGGISPAQSGRCGVPLAATVSPHRAGWPRLETGKGQQTGLTFSREHRSFSGKASFSTVMQLSMSEIVKDCVYACNSSSWLVLLLSRCARAANIFPSSSGVMVSSLSGASDTWSGDLVSSGIPWSVSSFATAERPRGMMTRR